MLAGLHHRDKKDGEGKRICTFDLMHVTHPLWLAELCPRRWWGRRVLPSLPHLIREKKALDTHSLPLHSRGVDRSSKSERTMDRPGIAGPAEPTFRRASQSFPDGAGDGVLSGLRLAGCQRTAEPEQRACGLAEAGAGRSGAPAADGPAEVRGEAAGTL